MKSKSLLTIADLNVEEIRLYLDTAKKFSGPKGVKQNFDLLKGKTILHLFFENSTRTKTSFEVATRRLGGFPLSLAVAQSSVNKGESLSDTAINVLALQGDAVVLRHSSSGAAEYLDQKVKVPVLNAGDGAHEHPTQALLDAFTLEEKWGKIEGKTVLILGDIAFSRVAHSNINLLKKLGANLIVCAPGTLLPAAVNLLGVEVCTDLDRTLPQVDAVIVLRMQLERHDQNQVPSLAEYREFWGLTRERQKLLQPSALILHPGPVSRGVEMDPEVVDCSQSVLFRQVENGVAVRMAALALHCNFEGVKAWTP